jgi:hypothetical protein
MSKTAQRLVIQIGSLKILGVKIILGMTHELQLALQLKIMYMPFLLQEYFIIMHNH